MKIGFFLILIACENNKPVEFPWYMYGTYNETVMLNGSLLDTINFTSVLKNKSFEKILLDLEVLKDNVEGIERFPFDNSPYDTVTKIRFISKYNMEDEYIIKNIIMKTLPFEPKPIYMIGNGWSSREYDIIIWHSNGGDMELNIFEKH